MLKNFFKVNNLELRNRTFRLSFQQSAESLVQGSVVNEKYNTVQGVDKAKISDKSRNEPNQVIDDAFQFINRVRYLKNFPLNVACKVMGGLAKKSLSGEILGILNIGCLTNLFQS